MKITDLKIYSVRNVAPNRGGPYFIFVKLTTDNNIDGFGEKQLIQFWDLGFVKNYIDIFKIEKLNDQD